MSSSSTVLIKDGKIIKDNKPRKNGYDQNFRNTVRTTKYMLKFVCKERQGRIYMIIKTILSIYNIIPTIIYTIFPGIIINELINGKEIHLLSVYVGILLLMPVVNKIIIRITENYLVGINLKLSAKYLKDYNYRTAMMDYETLDNPDIQVMTDRVFGTCYNALSVVDRLCSLIASMLGLIAIFSIIATLNVFIIILVILVIYINALITKRLNKKQFRNSKELSKFDRYLNSLLTVLNDIYYAKEVRIFNLKSYFADMLFEKRLEANNIKLKDTKNNLNAQIMFSGTNFFQQLVLYTYLIYKVVFKSLSIGNMSIYMAAVGQFASSFNNIISSYLEMAKSGLEIQEMIDFMDIPLKQYQTGTLKPICDENSIIEFRNVSFKYPGSESYALKNLNITLYFNEKLCIVGQNGSGKTTFIKLLTRLYFPTEGEILLNGTNIYKYNYEQYQRLFAPVFQDYALYSLTFSENIILSDERNNERLNNVCDKCGLTTLKKKLSKGFDTSVFKIFDDEGFEPSGGEGQKMAIARAVYHTASIYLLDEPTASLDPIAEYEIYKQFNNVITDKCAILVTHRLSAVQLADKVAVFDNGHVAEYGTHTELYDKGCIYTEMFDKQAQFYRDDPNATAKTNAAF